MDSWELVQNGRFEEAARAYTKTLRRNRTGPNYCNRGIAYLNLGDFDRALADFQAADDASDYTSDGYLQSVDVAHWLAGRESVATATWLDLVMATERGKIQYSDAAGGVESAFLLWFAGVRLTQQNLLTPARRLLRSKVKKAHGMNWTITNWPGPVAKFLLGKIKEERLRKEVSDVPNLCERELCQVEFYVGVRALQAGDRSKARRAFRKAADLQDARLENEYYLARHEVERMKVKP